MFILRFLTVTFLLVAFVCLTAVADNSGRIYGKITTVDDDVLEGLIRWDKNEGSWVDLLNGNKEIPKKYLKKSKNYNRKKYSDKESSIEIFGLKIGGGNSSNWSWSGSTAQSGLFFGHVKSMEVIDDGAVLITTKSGIEFELEGGSTDFGPGIREIIIEDKDEGELELVWDDIESIEFMEADRDEESNFGERLYGTLETRRGDKFTGFVCWDVDELFENDILDGDENRRSRKIKFEKIQAIERYSSSGSNVILKNGDEMVLRNSNDVDDDNRGIIIIDPGFGQVTVEWDEFERLDFEKAPSQVKYKDFDGGKPLKGTVYTEDGEKYKGYIRWDNDEEYTWEILDGKYRDIQFDIEFGKIEKIEKKSHRSSIVTIWDGRTFRLSGSNDVDDDNKGIFVKTDDGNEIEIEWDEFEQVVFEK